MTVTHTHTHIPQIIQCYISRKNSHQLVIELISGHGLEQWSAVLLCKGQTVNILGLGGVTSQLFLWSTNADNM